MSKIFTKILACILLALLTVSTVSMCMPVKASIGVSPLTYDEYNFSFKGTCTLARDCTGMFLDIRVKATASNNNNEYITLEVYIENTRATKTYNFYSDGQYHEFNNIFLGFSGGSGVAYTFTGANPAITINMYIDMSS